MYIDHFERLIKFYYEEKKMKMLHIPQWISIPFKWLHISFSLYVSLEMCIENEMEKEIPVEIIADCIRLFRYVFWMIVEHKLMHTHIQFVRMLWQ